jgi:hypothetical protein
LSRRPIIAAGVLTAMAVLRTRNKNVLSLNMKEPYKQGFLV